jgi:signal transduction histidine kinase
VIVKDVMTGLLPLAKRPSFIKAVDEVFDRARDARRILRHPAFLVTLAALFVAGILLSIFLRMSYVRELDGGRARAVTLSRLLEEQTVRSFQAVDLVLQSMSDALRSFAIPEHDPAFQALLTHRLKIIPHVRTLFVIGADGFIKHDTNYPRTPRVALADREYFMVHAADPSAGLHIGRPLLSRAVDRWFVSVSRRVDRPDGSFGGIVVAAVEPDFYDRFLAELEVDPNDTINLLHSDATLIARAPAGLDVVGQKFTSLALFSEHLPRSPSGTYTATSRLDGRQRIVSYRTVSGLPLVVTVALSREAILAGWTAYTYTSIVAFLLFAILCLAIAFTAGRRRIEASIAQERAVTAQKLEMLGQMTGGIAHDFNNLIAVASANLTLAERHIEDPPRFRIHVRGLRETLDRGASLTARLLAFARRQSLEVVPEDANELVRAFEPMLRQAAGSGVTLTLRLCPNLPPCLMDRAQFDAALLNLVINARDATADGGLIEIATSPWTEPAGSPTLKPGSYVRIKVRDTGSGMAPADLRRAFEPLFSTKGDKGTGLGLSQVYGFMRHIGGDARISSRLGAGTTVELLFPAGGRGGGEAGRERNPT